MSHHHGGDIGAAARRYGIAQEHWIDLSTGISPRAYPVENLPASAYARLPYESLALDDAAREFYGSPDVLACAGIQSVIHCLPTVLAARSAVRTALVPGPGYSEYARHFGDGGFDVCGYPTFTLNEQLEAVDSALSHNAARHLVIVNPNNPTATQIDVCTLKAWARRLECGGILIVDEAFADITPHASLLSAGDLPANVLVLRSFGKFFGLAGVRLGFAFAPQALRAELRRNLTLWGVSGPAQALGERALADGAWQRAQRRQLSADSEMTTALFAPLFSDWGAELCGSTHLFSSYLLSPCRARQAYSSLASLGVLCRVFQQGGRALLRLGVIDSSDDNVVAELRHRLLRLEPS